MRRSGSRHATGTAVAAPVSASKTATIPSVTASVSTVPASAPAPAAVPAPAAADEIDEQEAEESTFSAHVFAAYAVAAAWVMSVYTRLYSPLEAWIVARLHGLWVLAISMSPVLRRVDASFTQGHHR